jgi:two-component system chemotaxis sensor kinase CheA
VTTDDLARRLLVTFIGELDDQVSAMNADLIALEKDPVDEERLRSLFRAAHTIKGAARAAGVGIIEEVCHALEALLSDVRSGTAALTGSDFARLFAVVDGLGEAAAALGRGDVVEEKALRHLIPMLDAWSLALPQHAAEWRLHLQ